MLLLLAADIGDILIPVVIVLVMTVIPAAIWRDMKKTLADSAEGKSRGGNQGGDGQEDGAAQIILPLGWGGVFLTSEEKSILCLLPTLDAESVRDLSASEPPGDVEEVWVFNHRPGGLLPGSRVARQFGFDRVFATDPSQPIDRGFPEASPVAADEIPDERAWGDAKLERIDADGHAFRATFGEEETVVALGLNLAPPALIGPPLVHYVVGGVDFSGGVPKELTEVMTTLRALVLVDTGTGLASKTAVAFSQMGVDAFVFGGPWIEPVNDPLREAARGDDAEALAATLANFNSDADDDDDPPGDTVQVVATAIDLIARGELDAARRLLDAALTTREACGALWFQRGVLEFLSKNHDAAADAYRRAVEADRPMLQGWVNLALTLVELDRTDEAASAGVSALDASPLDPLAVDAALLVLARASRTQDARGVLERYGSLLGTIERGIWTSILEGGVLPQLNVVHRFEGHARLLIEEADGLLEAEAFADAEPLLRRALELDPQSLSAYAELGVTLAGLKRDDDAIALYREGITKVPGGELLRFNLANRCQELGRHDEANDEYRRCLELKPDWWAAHIRLIHGLKESGKQEASDSARKRFLEQDPPEEALAALSQLVD